jgi:hypothetical protein
MNDETPPRWGLIIALAVVIWLLGVQFGRLLH